MPGNKHEHLPPVGYVQVCDTVTHGDRIAEGIATMVLPAAFPAAIRALNLIREDSGGPSWPPEDKPTIAARWQPHLAEIDGALATLTDSAVAPEDADALNAVARDGFCYVCSELYTFCNGEESVIKAIASRSSSLTMASNFLNDFFEGWSLYEDHAFEPRAQRQA